MDMNDQFLKNNFQIQIYKTSFSELPMPNTHMQYLNDETHMSTYTDRHRHTVMV